MTVAFLGIDLAKNVFQLHGANADGQPILKRRIRREGLLAEIAELEPCVIGVEVCTGAFYWQRQFEVLGHTVKVIAPQYVRPFVKHQKNDQNDAEAICTALMLPNMKFVPTKSEEQQDIQALHRARRRLVNHRTALASQMRGLLLDRGIPIALSIGRARRAIPEVLEDQANGLSAMSREIIGDLFDFMGQIDVRITAFDRRIDAVFKSNEDCRRIARIHGARSVVRVAQRKTDAFSQWVNSLRERRGMNRAIVAVANKNARIIWAMLNRNEEFRAAV